MTYTTCKELIGKNAYEKEDMMQKLDIFLLNNRVTSEQYNELTVLINQEISKIIK